MINKITKSGITKIKLSVVLILLTLVSFSQSKSPLFEDGSRICFVGNSITHQGGFHHNIMLYQMTRFPQNQVIIFNCGIGGNQAYNVLERMENDILVHNPTHAVIMLGMNDVHLSLYGPNPTADPDTLNKRRVAIETYKNGMDSIVNIFLSKNIKVILQKPSIYDQTAIIPKPNHYGTNDALKECADFIQQLASKYNLPVIDYWTIMGRINKEIQKKDPAYTIVGKDRVHPGVTGHLIMTYQFLKTLQVPGYVSKIVVDRGKGPIQCMNCDVTSITNEKPGSLSFTVNEYALPFPVLESQKEGIKLVPFMNEINTELLQVRGFKRGQYQLKIDDVMVGSFSARQLKKGINLAEFENTPQYCQSENVLKKLQELWKVEGILRNLSFIEYTEAFKNYTGDKNNLNEFHNYFLKKLSGKDGSINPWFKEVIEAYVKNKPKQKEFEDEFFRLRNEAYQLAQPVVHNFEIYKKISQQ